MKDKKFLIQHGKNLNRYDQFQNALDAGFGIEFDLNVGLVVSHNLPFGDRADYMSYNELLYMVEAHMNATGNAVPIAIDIKSRWVTGLAVKYLVGRPLIEAAQIIAFDPVSIGLIQEAAKKSNIDIKTGWLYEKKEGVPAPVDPIALAISLGVDCILPHHSLVSRKLVEDANDEGIDVKTWTIDIKDIDEARRVLDCGVSAITTNQPGMMYRLLTAMPKSR